MSLYQNKTKKPQKWLFISLWHSVSDVRIWTSSQSSQYFCHDTPYGFLKKNHTCHFDEAAPLLFSLCGFYSLASVLMFVFFCHKSAYSPPDCQSESIHVGRYVLFLKSRKTWTAQISSFGDLYSSHLYLSAVGFQQTSGLILMCLLKLFIYTGLWLLIFYKEVKNVAELLLNLIESLVYSIFTHGFNGLNLAPHLQLWRKRSEIICEMSCSPKKLTNTRVNMAKIHGSVVSKIFLKFFF